MASGALAGVIYVDANATPGGNGSSWAQAFTDLQDAIDVAVTGDEIWIAEGTYKPSVSRNAVSGSLTTDPREATFYTKLEEITLYGAFVSGDTSVATRTGSSANTILSGDIGVVGDRTDNAYHVVVSHGVGPTVFSQFTLDGLTVKDGEADGTGGNSRGAGIYIDAKSNLPFLNVRMHLATLNGVTVSDSNADTSGGGIYAFETLLSINGSMIDNNSANGTGGASVGGGGVFAEQCLVEILGTTVTNNTTTSDGGGVLGLSSSFEVRDTDFRANDASDDGGALRTGGFVTNLRFNELFPTDPSSNWVIDSEFTSNTAGGFGGALVLTKASPAGREYIVYDNSFDSNTAADGGAAVLQSFQAPPGIFPPRWRVTNNYFYNNEATTGNGGALWVDPFNSIATMGHNTFVNNAADLGEGGGVYDRRAGDPDPGSGTVSGTPAYVHDYPLNIFWGNTASANPQLSIGSGSVQASVVQGGFPGPDNTSADPLFALNGPRILQGSSAIDIGSTAIAPLDYLDLDSDGSTTDPIPVDILNRSRPQDIELEKCGFSSGAKMDAGAYEFQEADFCLADWNGDGVIDSADSTDFTNDWTAADPCTDVNRDGVLDILDVVAFNNLPPC